MTGCSGDGIDHVQDFRGVPLSQGYGREIIGGYWGEKTSFYHLRHN